MARVKCITMQRDEEVLLEPWLRYYGYLFGFENLFVFDHGSVIPGVIEVLKKYEKLGVEVRWDLKTPGDYHGKGFHFANIIRHWDWVGDYDYAIPLDCDEFLALFLDGKVTCARSDIHDYLDNLAETTRPLGFDLSLFNVPNSPGWFWVDQYPKTFLPARSVKDIDFGNHVIQTQSGESARQTDFVYLHQHYKPLERLLIHARQKLDGFIDPDDLEALREYRGPGLHLVRYFFMDEREFQQQFDSKLLVQVPDFCLLLQGLGISDRSLVDHDASPFIEGSRLSVPGRGPSGKRKNLNFLPGIYHQLNPDVSSADIRALKHYLVFGGREGRLTQSTEKVG